MKKINLYILLTILSFYSSVCFSGKTTNVIILPDPVFFVHHIGVETATGENSKLGILVAYKPKSNRPTYGRSNDDVKNDFRRILIPWTYAKNGAWKDGLFVNALIGLENDGFNSKLGSSAEVIFINFGLFGGYQWYWSSGFNLSIMYGGAILLKSKSSQEVKASEKNNVVEFMNKNTKTNKHGAAGVILGWVF